MDLPAVSVNLIPVDIFSIGICKQRDIADLPDPKAAVQKMLQRVADQIKEMVRRRHGRNLRAVYTDKDSPLMRSLKKAVPLPIYRRFRREQLLVKLDTKAAARLSIGNLMLFLRVL